MPLTAYQYRPITPPAAGAVPELTQEGHSPGLSDSSAWSGNSSPDTLDIHVSTTPLDRSPIRQHGPALLPKIRTQDQSIRSSPIKGHHRRAISQSYIPPPQVQARPPIQRSTTVPPEYNPLLSPLSATSSHTNFTLFSAGVGSNVDSPISLTSPYRPSVSHCRSISASSLSDATLTRYGYPYRRQPAYISGAYWSPSVIPGSSVFTTQSSLPKQALCYDLPEEQRCGQPDEATMASLEYMQMANPPVNLVRMVNRQFSKAVPHFWWDVRNIETWDDFNFETIMSIPGFEPLLNMPVNDSAFPKPHISSSRLYPDSTGALIDIIKDFYISKVNAAMKVTQGSRFISMRVNKDKDGPSFYSNYQDDYERTITGNGRGRVVGIALPYERWNSGKRLEPGHDKLLYLDGLATLQHHMRQHQCRYGFIMNETELLCVRAGTDETPYFGHLELAPTIETRAQDGLTACLALWFLNMMAKEEPLEGQCSWRMNVGAPAAMTRQHVLSEKDKWIPAPGQMESRVAKRIRGWVHPKDPWNKKREGGKAWNK